MAERVKVWKASKDAVAGFMVKNGLAVMAGSPSNFIAIDKTGISLSGRGIAFNTVSENQRRGGFWILGNDFMRMLPSTIVTPQPMQIPMPPVGMLLAVTSDLPFFFGMLK